MKGVRIECIEEFFPELESILFSQSFGSKPKIDFIEVVLDNGETYRYIFEYSFGYFYIITE